MTAPTTGYGIPRREMLRQAVRGFVPGMLGWVAGAAAIVMLGRDGIRDNAWVYAPAFALWLAFAALFWPVVERRRPVLKWPAPRPYDARTGITTLICCVALQAAGRASPGYFRMSTLELWAVLIVLTIPWIVLDLVPRLLRPQGWADLRPHGHPPHGVSLVVAGSLIAALAAWTAANAQLIALHPDQPADQFLFNRDPVTPDGPAVLTSGSFVLIGSLAMLAFGSWWIGAARIFYAAMVGIYLWLVFWAEGVWGSIRVGVTGVVGPREAVLALQVVAGAILLTVLAIGYVFRRRRSLLAPESRNAPTGAFDTGIVSTE